MSRVKITNLKQGACVINSLKVTIPGLASIIREDSVVGDPDLSELEAYGIISITPVFVEETPKASPSPAETKAPTSSADKGAKTKTGKKLTTAKNAKNAKSSQKAEPAQVTPPAQQSKPPVKRSTPVYADVDNLNDAMGARVVVMGQNGPEIKKMNAGINGTDSPTIIGGDSEATDGEQPEKGFTTI